MNAHTIFRLAGIQGNAALLVLSSLALAPLLPVLLIVFLATACYIKLAGWLGTAVQRRMALHTRTPQTGTAGPLRLLIAD